MRPVTVYRPVVSDRLRSSGTANLLGDGVNFPGDVVGRKAARREPDALNRVF